MARQSSDVKLCITHPCTSSPCFLDATVHAHLAYLDHTYFCQHCHNLRLAAGLPTRICARLVTIHLCLLQDDVAGCFEYYADLAEKLDKRQGQALQLPMEEFKGAIRREPLGVVGLITPWNYPMLMAAVGSSTAYAQFCAACGAGSIRREYARRGTVIANKIIGLASKTDIVKVGVQAYGRIEAQS